MIQRDRSVSRTFRYEFEVFQAGAELYLPLQRPALLVQDASGRILSHLQAPDFLADGALKGAELLAQVEPLFCAPATPSGASGCGSWRWRRSTSRKTRTS